MEDNPKVTCRDAFSVASNSHISHDQYNALVTSNAILCRNMETLKTIVMKLATELDKALACQSDLRHSSSSTTATDGSPIPAAVDAETTKGLPCSASTSNVDSVSVGGNTSTNAAHAANNNDLADRRQALAYEKQIADLYVLLKRKDTTIDDLKKQLKHEEQRSQQVWEEVLAEKNTLIQELKAQLAASSTRR